MTTEEQKNSSDIQQINGTENDKSDEHDNEISVTSTEEKSSAPPQRRLRFFRSKRKLRLHDEGSDQVDNNDNGTDEPVQPSEESEKPIEKTPMEESSTIETPFVLEHPKTRRQLSPPPPLPSTDDNDEVDSSSISDENQFSPIHNDQNVERKKFVLENETTETPKVVVQPRTSLPSIYSGFQRKKSQSVKLTRIDPMDSCQKKNVRFADDFGLDLSQVKVIKSDELPHVPSAAFKDLHISQDENEMSFYEERMRTITYLEQQFDNPIHSHGFDERVARQKIVLEQANAIDNRIYGTIKLVSFGLNKRVKIRLTTDNWQSFTDHDAIYITDSYDGVYDRFTFTLDVDRDRICLGNNIQFCIGYESFGGQEYWDNNYHQNYRFDCTSRDVPDYSG